MAYYYVLLLLPTLQLTRAALRRWYTWNCSPPYARITSSFARLFVAFAGTKHYCLTAVNRDGALCCPDFPRCRGLKHVFFFPYSAIDRCTISKFARRSRSLLRISSNLPRASWARGKRRNRYRPNDAIRRRSCDKRIPTKSGIRESNPPPRLGKPMHYRCANAAKSLQKYNIFFNCANI